MKFRSSFVRNLEDIWQTYGPWKGEECFFPFWKHLIASDTLHGPSFFLPPLLLFWTPVAGAGSKSTSHLKFEGCRRMCQTSRCPFVSQNDQNWHLGKIVWVAHATWHPWEVEQKRNYCTSERTFAFIFLPYVWNFDCKRDLFLLRLYHCIEYSFCLRIDVIMVVFLL